MNGEVAPRSQLASVAAIAVEPLVIGRYALFDEIASGGMATVYYGRLIGAAGFARPVAIKRLASRLASDQASRAMLVDEARLGARIHHPNVVQILDVVSHGSELLLVMEYVHGETLARLARQARSRGQHVPVPIAVAIATDMLHGLHAAHEVMGEDGLPLNIVHRDVSPQNVLVGRDGVSRVLDFGIARADHTREDTDSGIVKGKVAYMSPEQLLGERVTRRTDVFAAGVVLWEMLTGKRLLVGGENGDSLLMDTLLRGSFDPPSHHRKSLDPALDAIVMCALDRNPNERFANASEMARTLEGVSIVATSTQVGEWVQSLAGEVLAERGRKLSAFERADAPRTMPRGLPVNPSTTAETPRPPPPAPLATPPPPPKAERFLMLAASFALGVATMAGASWWISNHREPVAGAAPHDDAIPMDAATTRFGSRDGARTRSPSPGP